MSRSGDTEEEALTRLRVLSQHENSKLLTVARGVVEEAVRRARVRHQLTALSRFRDQERLAPEPNLFAHMSRSLREC